MIISPFRVVYDACVLYPAPLRDTLVRVAIAGVVQAKWTEQILDECFRSLSRNRPDIPHEAITRVRDLMNGAVRDAVVEDYEHLIDSISLPDPDDRHVVAAAIQSGAQVIVTWNLKDFPASALPGGIEAQSPDEFLTHVWGVNPVKVRRALEEQAAGRGTDIASILGVLEKNRLSTFVANLRSTR